MIITTTSTIEGSPIRQYLGIATGEVIIGANVFRDFKASITDLVGGVRALTKASFRKREIRHLLR